MSRLAIVDRPSVDSVWEGLLQIQRTWSADPDFNWWAFIDEELKVVSAARVEDFSSDCGFEAASFFGGADQILLI
jgi:hypothetical protein